MNDKTTIQGLLDETVEGELSTSLPQVPIGIYMAQIDKLDDVEMIQTKNGPKPMLKPRFKPLSAESGQEWNPEENYAPVYLSVWLDLTPNKTLKTGKSDNIQLGRLMAACGLNEGSRNIRALFGQTCKIEVEHSIYKGEAFAQVKRVILPEA